MLSGCRILDLTDEKGSLCGKILGDLGADVIKIEKPAGDPARRRGPFYHDIPDPEKSLHWFALNGSKRGITLNLGDPEGQEIFKKLSDRADVVIESFSPGYMDGLDLGFTGLNTRNPRLIMTSITFFGQTGPYKNRKASDITILAMSGMELITGDMDTPPVRLCLEQSYCLASAHAAAGTLLALYYRNASERGQHVDVSIYESAVRANYREPFFWEFTKTTTPRMGNIFSRGGQGYRQFWPCKDGYVTWMLLPENPRSVRGFIEWMREEGKAGRWAEINWDEVTSFVQWSDEDVQAVEEAITSFIATRTTKELEAASITKGLLLSPVSRIDFVAGDEQLAARHFWKDVEHPELGTAITYPRYTYLSNEVVNEIRVRAPLIGEHNEEVYGKEMGFSRETISSLQQRGIL